MAKLDSSTLYSSIEGITTQAGLLNSIRMSASQNYQSVVPLASSNNISAVGAGIIKFSTTTNEFINLLVERIAVTYLNSSKLQNDFKIFRSGSISNGRHIMDIFVDKLEATEFDLYGGEDDAFTVEKPDIKVVFHTRNRRDKYSVTISKQDLETAFTSSLELDNFIVSVLEQLYSSNEGDEYDYSMSLFDNYNEKDLFTKIPIKDFNSSGISREERKSRLEDLVESVRATVTRMGLGRGTRAYNALSVRRRSRAEDLFLFISPELESAIDVNVLASAFHMDKASFLSHVMVVNDFADTKMKAVLADRNWFRIYINERYMATNSNGSNMTWKYFYHCWDTYSVSQLENAVSFTTSEATEVYRVGFQNMSVDVRGGKTFTPMPILRGYGDIDSSKLSFTLTGGVSADTKVDATTGLVTVGLDESSNKLVLTATYDNTGNVDSDGNVSENVSATMDIYPVKTIVTTETVTPPDGGDGSGTEE